MTVQGLDRLKTKLRALPAAAEKEIREALVAGAEEMVALAKSLVPVDSGALRDSIGWTFGEAPKGSVALAKGQAGADRITVYAGNESAFYARWVEFGTVKMGAHPFFFPSYRALKKRMRSRITRATKKAAQAVAAGGQ